ncbi:hypothetical protein VYM61_002808 [Acinetobacter baumannii]|nr:hypothetical protein [Acinetobacter baumannii]
MEMRVGLKVGCKFFFKFDEEDLRVLSGSGWQHASYDSIQEYIDEGDQLLWSREAVKKDPALISGAEAMIAALDGKHVVWQWSDGCGNWQAFNDEEWTVEDLKSDRYHFKIIPQTIKLELELPKPFEPKDNDWVWTISGVQEGGITQMLHRDGNDYPLGAWRTEEEVKQVVEQLRKIRGNNS